MHRIVKCHMSYAICQMLIITDVSNKIILLNYRSKFKSMGNQIAGGLCGNSIFNQLSTQYGGDFVKLIAAEKGKQVINEKFSGFQQQAQQIFGGFQTKTTNIVGDQSGKLKSVFEDAKKQVDNVVPGGIPALQRLKGQSINQFSGFNKLQGSIDNVKNDTFTKISAQRTNILTDLAFKKSAMINKIDEQRPKVPIYEELPQPLKSAILAQGQKQFTQQIAANKDTIAKQALAQFNPSAVNGLFGQLSPQGILQNIVGGAASQFMSNLGLGGLGNLIGGGGAGGIGNLIGGGGAGGIGNMIGGGGIGNTIGNFF